MTARDRAWRAGGIAAFATACGIGVANRLGSGDVADATGGILLGLLGFGLAIAGIVLLLQGKRIPVSLQAERRRQRAARIRR
jgi:hypothetical protein